jgi:hypothetical protein
MDERHTLNLHQGHSSKPDTPLRRGPSDTRERDKVGKATRYLVLTGAVTREDGESKPEQSLSVQAASVTKQCAKRSGETWGA